MQKFKTAIMNIFIKAIKGREINALGSVFMISICFLQTYGIILEDNKNLSWNDSTIGEYVSKVFSVIRLVPYLMSLTSAQFYWTAFILCCFATNNSFYKYPHTLRLVLLSSHMLILQDQLFFNSNGLLSLQLTCVLLDIIQSNIRVCDDSNQM